MRAKYFFWLAVIFLLGSGTVLVRPAQATEQISVASGDWNFKPTPVVPGQDTVVYVRLHNDGNQDIEGFVQMSDNGLGLGQERAFSIRAGGLPEEIWFHWQPSDGSHKLTLSQTNTAHQPASISAAPYVVTVISDNDRDGISDAQDSDDDNDGMPDIWEIEHKLDHFNPQDRDLDPDADGLTNLQEFFLGTDPHNKDTDGDGLPDGQDPAPRDPNLPAKPKPAAAISNPAPTVGSGGGTNGGRSVVKVGGTVENHKNNNDVVKKIETKIPTVIPSEPRRTEVTNSNLQKSKSDQDDSFLKGKKINKVRSPESWLSEHGLDAVGLALMLIVLLGTGWWIFHASRKTE